MIGCLRLPYFAAAALRREYRLAADIPLGIVRRGKLIASCAQCSETGIQVGFTTKQAKAILPELVTVEDDEAIRQGVLDRLLTLLAELLPRLECSPEIATVGRGRKKVKLLPDPQQAVILYVDFETFRSSDAGQILQQMSAVVFDQVEIVPGLGLAGGKFTAYAAASSGAFDQINHVSIGAEAAFLADLPIRLLPLDGETFRRLILFGLNTLGQVATLPQESMLIQFGAQGFMLWQLAIGRDLRPVVPRRAGLAERLRYDDDDGIVNHAALETLLRAMAVDLAERLQITGHMGHTLTLTLRFADKTLRERRQALRQPVFDTPQLTKQLLQLMTRLMPISHGIVGVEIAVQDLSPLAGRQLDLFVHLTEQRDHLTEALDTLTARYGSEPFLWITPTDPAARRIEQRYRLRRINER